MSKANIFSVVAFGAAIVLIALNFDIGFRATADQMHSTEEAIRLPFAEVIRRNVAGAIDQGRVGFLIVQPLLSLGAYFGDFFLYPAICVAILGLIVYATFRWVETLFGGRLALPMVAIYLAFLPLGLNHWLPNAYAMQFVPLALALPARNALTTGTRSVPQQAILIVTVFIGAIAYELFFTMLLAMLAVEIALHVLDRQAAGWPRMPFILIQAGILIAAAGCMIAFRRVFPSHYSGNSFEGFSVLLTAAQTTLLHIKSGTTIGSIFRPPHYAFAARDILVALLVGVGLAAAAARFEFTGGRRKGLVLIAVGLVIAVAVTFPLGLSDKYNDWCIVHGDCHYLDNRLSLLGLVIVDVGLGVLVFGPRLYRPLLILGCVVFGGATYLVNLAQRPLIDFGVRAEDEAKSFVCANPDPSTDSRGVAERLAQSRVAFHPHFTPELKTGYWTRYIQHLRAQRLWFCP